MQVRFVDDFQALRRKSVGQFLDDDIFGLHGVRLGHANRRGQCPPHAKVRGGAVTHGRIAWKRLASGTQPFA
jgi:hypothetical protein